MMFWRARQRLELLPGEVIRFRNKRYFTRIWMASPVLLGVAAGLLGPAVSPWAAGIFVGTAVVGMVVFVWAVPPKGGRRSYEVTATELVIRTPEGQRVIPWREVEYLLHRPTVSTRARGGTTTHWEYIELILRRRGPRASAGRPAAPRRRWAEGRRFRVQVQEGRRILIQGVHRQSALSTLIIDQCRAHIVRALRAGFDRYGKLEYGDFLLTYEGVQAVNGVLRWRTDWQFSRSATEDGIELRIFSTLDNESVTGWVPEAMTALNLLTTLAEQQNTDE